MALLTTRNVAKLLGVTSATIARWRARGLPCYRPGGPHGRLHYDEAEVLAWATGQHDAAKDLPK
jgi:excisionase family DNA binding protein